MLFEWDEEKNEINIKNHGLDFELASFVFPIQIAQERSAYYGC